MLTDGTLLTFAPDSDILGGTEYTATLRMTLTDLSGNALDAEVAWTFTTASQ